MYFSFILYIQSIKQKIMEVETFKNICDSGISLVELYINPTKQINIHISNKSYTFHVVLCDYKGYDCKISSVGANLWFRTPKGMNFEKYKSLKTLQKALVHYIRKYVQDVENISFSLSNEVYTF